MFMGKNWRLGARLFHRRKPRYAIYLGRTKKLLPRRKEHYNCWSRKNRNKKHFKIPPMRGRMYFITPAGLPKDIILEMESLGLTHYGILAYLSDSNRTLFQT